MAITKDDIRLGLARTLRETVEEYAEELRTIRSRELGLHKGAKKLAKSELCALCGNEDVPGSCTCVPSLVKNSALGYGQTPGADMAMGKDDTWNPNTDGKVRGSVIERQRAAVPKGATAVSAVPKKSPKDIRGVAADSVKVPMAPKPAAMPMGKEELCKACGKSHLEKCGETKVIKKSELQKDAAGLAFGLKTAKPEPMAPAGNPGMTRNPNTPVHPETTATLQRLRQETRPGDMHPSISQSIGEAKTMQAQKVAAAPARKQLPFVPTKTAARPGASTVSDLRQKLGAITQSRVANTGNEATDLKADMKAGGVGWLNNIISRFHGTGNKTWEAMRGAGAAQSGFGRVASAFASLTRSEELAKTSITQANQEIQGFQSLASNPTAVPQGAVASPHIAQVNTDLHGFRSILGNCAYCSQPEHESHCS